MPEELPWVKRRGKKLYIQTTLPPKPGSGKLKPHRQLIATGLDDTPRGRVQFLAMVEKLRKELARNTFVWEQWSPELRDTAALVERLRQQKVAMGVTLPVWEAYQRLFDMLPDGPLTPAKLMAPLEGMDVASAAYKRSCVILQHLGKVAWGEDFVLEVPTPLYSERRVKERVIPTDSEIEAVLDGLSPHLQWILGMLAAYGIRPSELFNSDFEGETLRVRANTKTGARLVYAVPTRWIERWGLLEPRWPKSWTDLRTLEGRKAWLAARSQKRKPDEADQIGNGRWTYLIQNMVRRRKHEIPWTLYAFRHAYALRCMRSGVPTTIAARMMGHAETMHIKTYRKWLSEEMVGDFMRNLQP